MSVGTTGYKSRVSTSQLERSQVSVEQSSEANSPNGSVRRSVMKKFTSPSPQRKSVSASSTQRRLLETQYANKKKRYVTLQKELLDKQKLIRELHEEISQLRERVIASGAKDPGKLEDCKIAAKAPAETIGGSGEQLQETLPSDFMKSLECRLRDIPKTYEELCQDAVEKHSSIVSWLTDFGQEEIAVIDPELASELKSYQRENETLRFRLDEVKSSQIDRMSDVIKSAFDLYKEYENYRDRLKEIGCEDGKGLREKLNVALEELQAEREKANQGRDRLKQTEAQLQRARGKVRELETHVASDEAKIQKLQENVRSLEVQIKQKEQAMEHKVKDIQKTMKNSEGLVAKMEKQRESFEARLTELKEKMNSKEEEAANAIREMTERMEAVNAEINEEKVKRQQAENALAELEERYKKLEEKSQQLCELAEKNKEFAITEGTHTENEARLFNELQAARAELQEKNDKISELQREKEEIVAVMHQAANRDDEDDSKEKLAAELVAKCAELQNLTIQYTQLQNSARIVQEKNAALKRQLTEIQSRLHAQSKEGGKSAWSAHTIELQQQISDLRNSLAEAVKHNEELETALTQKQLELEQRDRVMREQSKFLKVRDELLGILKGNTQVDGKVSGDDQDLDEVSKQIAAKTEAIQELYTSLENKQMQVMRLEKMVKLMEDQQDRAQAQRTRLENRIAQLELTLQEKSKEHRSRGFGIL